MKIFRIILLLLIFVFVAFYTKLQRLESMAWVDPLQVSIYPINGDGSVLTDQYISALSENDFHNVEVFFKKQWGVYSELDFDPITVTLKPLVMSQPPFPPSGSNVLKVIFWSLRLRLWSYRNSMSSNKSTVNVFVRYHQVNENSRLAHSLGLQKGLIGVVNGYASDQYQEQNNVVIAHELLHTVGASDKYSLSTGQPIYPDGFAKPDQRYRQSKAEIMAGKIPVNENESVMPMSLRQCVVGNETAKEIGWLGAIIDINQ